MIAIEHNIFTTTTKVRDKQEMKAKNEKSKGLFPTQKLLTPKHKKSTQRFTAQRHLKKQLSTFKPNHLGSFFTHSLSPSKVSLDGHDEL